MRSQSGKKLLSILLMFMMVLVLMPQVSAAAYAGFQYEHDPMENPKAAQDIVVNPDAVYGFSPNPESSRLGVYADAIDWTDEDQVADAKAKREAYHEQNAELYKIIEEGLANGESMEEIARKVSTRRNEIRLEAYADDPEGLALVKQSNLETYGNEMGPTPDYLYEKYGLWQTVIEKACSTNAGMDACLGLYDKYYYTYGLDEDPLDDDEDDDPDDPAVIDPKEGEPEDTSVDSIISGLSTEEKITMMLMPAFRTYDGTNVTALNDDLKNFLSDYGFSGVILFAQNNVSTEQTAELIHELQQANIADEARPQLLISVDQEGAGVTRLSHGTQGPGNMGLGATGDPQNAYDMGEIIGEELAAIGYNVDFAPVVDVNNNPSNPVIGVRSFSDDPDTVSQFGSSFMSGLKSQNVITSLKHFPGHGDTDTDSHTGLPMVEKTYEELLENELIPFKACIDDGAEMIMTAHIQYPEIEKETYTSIKDGSEIYLPATLSKTIITGILREDLGFDGVVITDAMEMAAISQNFNRLDAAKLAINAGVDILMIPVQTTSLDGIADIKQYISDVASLVDSGEISADNVDAAVRRILTLKENNGLLETYDGSDISEKIDSALSKVGSKANHDKEWEIAKRSITLVKNDEETLPIKNNEKTVILVPYSNEINSAEYAIDRLKEEGLISEDMDITVTLTNGMSLEEMEEAVDGAVNVIAVTEQYSQAALGGATYEKFDGLADYVHDKGGKIVFVSCYLPYDSARLQKGDAILLAYSAKGMNVKPDFSSGSVPTYGVSIPVGIYTAFNKDAVLGQLPVNIPQLDENYRYTDQYLYDRGYGLQYASEEDDDTTGEYVIDSCTGLSGSNKDQWQKGSGTDAVITVKLTADDEECFDHFVGVSIDGKELARDTDYTAEKGSTIVTLKVALMEKLSLGKHTVSILFDNGKVDKEFTILEAENSGNGKDGEDDTEVPRTGDDSGLMMWILLLALSAVGAICLGRRKFN